MPVIATVRIASVTVWIISALITTVAFLIALTVAVLSVVALTITALIVATGVVFVVGTPKLLTVALTGILICLIAVTVVGAVTSASWLLSVYALTAILTLVKGALFLGKRYGISSTVSAVRALLF